MTDTRMFRTVALVTILMCAITAMTFATGSAEGSASASSSGPTTLSLFVDQTWWPAKEWTGPVPEEITKITGVLPEVTIASDERQLPLMIASGSLPDLVATSTQHKRMGQAEISYAWDDLIKQYAPDFTIDPVVIGVNSVDDGHFYTVKNNFSTAAEFAAHQGYALDQSAAIMARKDILEALGNPQIRTLDDFRNLLTTVKQKYPTMTPLVLNTPVWAKPYFANQFGVSDGFSDVNGKLVYMLNMPGYKEMYLYLNDLFRQGLIATENLAYKQDQQSVDLAAKGSAFAIEWTTGGVGNMNARAAQAGNSFEFIYLPIKINAAFRNESHNVGWQGLYITKNNSNPSLSINFMKFLYSQAGQQLTMYGREGTDWQWSEGNHYPVFNYDYFSNDEKLRIGVTYWGLFIDSFVTEALTRFNPGTETTRISQELMKVYTTNPAIGLVEPEADTQEAVILANLKNMIQSEETKVYLAPTREAAAAAYDEMVAKAQQIGVAQLESWANTRYQQVKVLFQ